MAITTDPVANATLPRSAESFTTAVPIRARYENWIGGEYCPPARGQYFTNVSPLTGQPFM